MKKRISLFLLILFSCSYMHAQEVSPADTIVVLSVRQSAPGGATKVGHIKIRDGGFKLKCDYTTVIDQARKRAREKGGNVIKLTKVSQPDVWSTCYRITADIMKVADINSVFKATSLARDSIIRSLLPDTAKYALLYVFRPQGVGALVGYKLRMNGDSILCRVHDNTKFVIKLYKEGVTTFSAKTESETKEEMNIKFGQAYFLHCGIEMGVLVGEPTLNFVTPETGLDEYNGIKKIPDTPY